jgi:opacity protein-like surface antigen
MCIAWSTMSFLRIIVLAAITGAVAPFCHAGTYVKAAGLYNRPSDIHIDNPTNFRASLKRNVGFSLALGYKFTVFRVEAEGQYLRSNTEPEETAGTLFGGIGRTTGSTRETAGLVNGYVDLPSYFGLSPYVGLGLGYARVKLDDLGRTRNGAATLQFSGREAVFGYQGMVGLQYSVFGQATLNAGYRIGKREDLAVRDVLGDLRHTLRLGNHRAFEIGLSLGF